MAGPGYLYGAKLPDKVKPMQKLCYRVFYTQGSSKSEAFKGKLTEIIQRNNLVCDIDWIDVVKGKIDNLDVHLVSTPMLQRVFPLPEEQFSWGCTS